MNTIFKPFAALATRLKNNSFSKAVIKLTFFYTLGVTFLLVIFSTIVYGLFVRTIHEPRHDEHFEIREISDDSFVIEVKQQREALQEELQENLLNTLITADIFLFILTVFVSYILSKKTLLPLERAYKKQEEFISNAAHELRTPLAVMKAGTELTLSKDRNENEYKKFLGESLEEINRLILMANDLLSLARNNNVDHKNMFSLSDCLHEQVASISTYAKTKGISLVSNIEQDSSIMGNQQEIARMVMNLLKNAIDYNKENGSVTLLLVKKDKKAEISLSDTGIGISQKDLPHIFERFYKVEECRTQCVDSGSGLGLSLVWEIIKKHNGTIKVESELGKGTTFSIKLPLV